MILIKHWYLTNNAVLSHKSVTCQHLRLQSTVFLKITNSHNRFWKITPTRKLHVLFLVHCCHELQVNQSHTAPVYVFLPVMIITSGCAIDNIRLSLGTTSVGKLLSYVSFFLHVTAVPLGIIFITHITEVSSTPDVSSVLNVDWIFLFITKFCYFY